ncbi:MAG: hypothetical protein PQJ59_06445 [Spirochaetales bacterium]|nr:hypothetical protein [Spirochaetales bacterium]
MSTLTSVIPPAIERHLEDVIKTFGLDSDMDTMARLKSGWLEKEEAFKEQMFNMGMEETDHFDKDDERGVLALTYSGSLISIGPITEGDRKVDYTSIGFRHDVPDSLTKEGSLLAEDMSLESGVVFDGGPIQKTSPVYKIVVCPESLETEEQEDLIDQATTMIIDTFAGINSDTIVLE